MIVTTRPMALFILAALLGGTPALAMQVEPPRTPARPALLRPGPPSQPDYSITTKIQPAEHVGPCPAKVAFIATITAKKAGPVKYRLRTSDNAYDPVREMMFTAPGTKTFAVSRNLPPPGSGWGYFEIVGPVTASSEMAYYDIKCTNDPVAPSARSPSAGAAETYPTQRKGAGRSQPGSSPTSSAPGQVITQAPIQPEIYLPKPDLVITAVSGSPVKGQGGLVWKFLVEITNQGPAEAGASMLCAHENPAQAPQASKNPIPKLGTSQNTQVEYWYGKPTWWFVEGGERKKRPLVFVADCLGSLTEGSEGNNQYPIWLYWDPTETKTWEPAQ